MPANSWMRNDHLDGNPFFYQGNRSGVLLYHGFTATTTEVRLLADYLASAGYTVFAPLLPGHGTSPDDLNHCTWQDWVQSAERDLQSIRKSCDQVWVGGESLGALVAMHLAIQHPEIQGCMVYAAALNVPKLRYARLVKLVRPYIQKRGADDGLPWKGYTVYPVKAAVQFTQFQAVIRKLLPELLVPLLILQGCQDHTVDIQGSQKIYDQAGSSYKELHWLDDSPHCLLIAQEFNKAAQLTLGFLQKTSQPTHDNLSTRESQ